MEALNTIVLLAQLLLFLQAARLLLKIWPQLKLLIIPPRQILTHSTFPTSPPLQPSN